MSEVWYVATTPIALLLAFVVLAVLVAAAVAQRALDRRTPEQRHIDALARGDRRDARCPTFRR